MSIFSSFKNIVGTGKSKFTAKPSLFHNVKLRNPEERNEPTMFADESSGYSETPSNLPNQNYQGQHYYQNEEPQTETAMADSEPVRDKDHIYISPGEPLDGSRAKAKEESNIEEIYDGPVYKYGPVAKETPDNTEEPVYKVGAEPRVFDDTPPVYKCGPENVKKADDSEPVYKVGAEPRVIDDTPVVYKFGPDPEKIKAIQEQPVPEYRIGPADRTQNAEKNKSDLVEVVSTGEHSSLETTRTGSSNVFEEKNSGNDFEEIENEKSSDLSAHTRISGSSIKEESPVDSLGIEEISIPEKELPAKKDGVFFGNSRHGSDSGAFIPPFVKEQMGHQSDTHDPSYASGREFGYDAQNSPNENSARLNLQQNRVESGSDQTIAGISPDNWNNIGLGFSIILYFRQLFASLFTFTNLGIMCPCFSLRLGPSYPSSMPVCYSIVGFLLGLCSIGLDHFADGYLNAFFILGLFILIVGLNGFRGIGELLSAYARKRPDTYFKSAVVCIYTILCAAVLNNLTTGAYVIDLSFAFGIAGLMLLSSYAACTLNFGLRPDPMDNFGHMSLASVIVSGIVCIAATFVIFAPYMALSLSGIALLVRLIIGHFMLSRGMFASRNAVCGVQFMILLLLLIDILILGDTLIILNPYIFS